MNNSFKKDLMDFLINEKIQDYIENNQWDQVFEYIEENFIALGFSGFFTDFIIKAGINFCPYITKLPNRSFARSSLLKEANLRRCTSLGSRCFRSSNIELIYLSKNSLTNIDVGILSNVKNKVTIKWDGTYQDWVNIRRNSNCWYNYQNIITIDCTDGIFTEDSNFG